MSRAAIGTRVMAALVVASLAVGASGLAQDEPKAAAPDDFAQYVQKPTAEHKRLRKDLGVWDAEVKSWMAPDTEPMVSKGVERNRMLAGGLWLISDFQGDFGGLEFRGHGVYGYDTHKGKYVGTWIDSMSSSVMSMEGTHDKATESITFVGETVDPTGQAMEIRSVASYKDGGRSMTMSMRPKGSDGEFFTMMEITYTKSAEQPARKAARP